MTQSYADKMGDYAVEQGWLAPEQRKQLGLLTAKQYQQAAKKVRPTRVLVKDGARALTSRAATTLNLRVVPLPIAQANEAVCRACEHFTTLRNAEPACNRCNCSNKYLRSKWRDARQKCPLSPPKWDNRTLAPERPAAGDTHGKRSA